MNSDYVQLDEGALPRVPVKPVRTEGPARGLAWVRDEIDPASCGVILQEDALAEMRALADWLEANPLPALLREPGEFPTPALSAVMQQVKARLDEGPGVAVVDRLPLDQLNQETAVAIYWLMARMLGQTVAQTLIGQKKE